MPVPSLSESQRRLTAAAIYSEPLKPWETRALRLEPLRRDQDEGDVIEVHLETAVIPHLEGLGLVGSGEVVFYEALSYTWDSPVLSHAIRCNGLDFSVTANLHAALVQLRSSDVHRWLWIDALCINQYDEAEKERQIRNMFHIYRKASTVLVWLGPAGPGTSLGADIVNVYDTIWQDNRITEFPNAVRDFLMREAYKNNNTSVYVDEFLNDLRENRPSDDERAGIDTLGLVSMALDGITNILGRAWIRRTWIIQEIAAANNVKFQCGQSILSYDGFFDVIPNVGILLFRMLSVLLAEDEDQTVSERLRKRPRVGFHVFPSGLDIRYEGPAAFRESLRFTEVLHQLRLLVNDPGRIQSPYTQTELLLVFLVETTSRGFDSSIAVDRLYSLAAMADAISSASWGLAHNRRTVSSPQQLPVDYSVNLQAAVLRLLKIRMNEISHFYITIEMLSFIHKPGRWNLGTEDQETKSILFSMCSAYSSPPSWLKLLEFDGRLLSTYLSRTGSLQKSRQFQKDWWWAEQNVTEPDTLLMLGKELGRLVVDPEGLPSRAWVALPCPLGQELETYCNKYQRPVRALHQGCPVERPEEGDEASLDNTEPGSRQKGLGEQETALSQIGSGSDEESNSEVRYWNWEFPLDARDGDVIVVFIDTCALVRPAHGERYIVVKKDLRVPVDPSEDIYGDWEFLWNHREDLDTFICI